MPLRRTRRTTLPALVASLGFLLCIAATAAQDTSAPAKPGQPPQSLEALADMAQKGVEEIRGWKFKRPVQRKVYSEAELRKWLEKKLFEEELPEPKLRRIQAVLRMTGIIPADSDIRRTYMDVLMNQIGGFYDPETNTFYMLARGGVDYGPLINGMLIAHELTHALDDQYFDLDKVIDAARGTLDGEFAVAAVVEGSAMVVGMRYMMNEQRSGQYDVAQLQQVMAQEMERSKLLFDVPPFYSSIVANYICGMNFFLKGNMAARHLDRRDESGDALKLIVKRMPTSSEQVLHPEKYWDESKRDEPVIVDDAAVEKLLAGPDRFVVHKDTAGELLCALITSPESVRKLNVVSMGIPATWSTEEAAGWGGDRFLLLSRGANPQAAEKFETLQGVWLTLWDTRYDRNEFHEVYMQDRPEPPRLAFKLGDRGVVFFFGFEPPEAEGLAKKLEESRLKLTSGGKPWSWDDKTR